MVRRGYLYVIVIIFLTAPRGVVLAQNAQEEQEQKQDQQQEPPDQQQRKTPPPVEPGEVVRPSETASTPSTVRRIATNFWQDQKGMWTSPFHINNDNAKWWGLFVGS